MAEVEGHIFCPFCRANVEVKINKSGRAYFVCNGSADSKACASTATMGPLPTMAALKEIDAKKGAKPDGGSEQEIDGGPVPRAEPEADPTGETGEGGNEPEPDGEPGGFGLFN